MLALNQVVAMPKRQNLKEPVLLLDGRTAPAEVVTRALQCGYNGILVDNESMERLRPLLSPRLQVLLLLEEAEPTVSPELNLTLVSHDSPRLEKLAEKGFSTAYRAPVTDNQSLHDAIALGRLHNFVLMSFKDPTNIPLELVIASLQSSETVLIKEIEPRDTNDAIVSLGVMEVGADGILFTPPSIEALEAFNLRWQEMHRATLPLQVGKVISSRSIGMGYRACIDLATLFKPTEGMIVGSTSHGGILCCPEVFHLPYMELRPFRVNAGAVHSYVYNLDDKTDYMTELRAGSSVMIADMSGEVRRAFVGRVKTEVRPLRLIEVEFAGGERVNVLMQDDWHVRIYSGDGLPRNITELKPGDPVMGYVASPGRHVGIKVSENILEN